MTHTIPKLAAAALAVLVGAANAQDDTKPEQVADVEKVVKEEAGQQVEETRIEGRLQGVRVKPRHGPEYFIDDRAGDGSLSTPEGDDLGSQPNIRTWKLGTW